jgi:hypothetical protein
MQNADLCEIQFLNFPQLCLLDVITCIQMETRFNVSLTLSVPVRICDERIGRQTIFHHLLAKVACVIHHTLIYLKTGQLVLIGPALAEPSSDGGSKSHRNTESGKVRTSLESRPREIGITLQI